MAHLCFPPATASASEAPLAAPALRLQAPSWRPTPGPLVTGLHPALAPVQYAVFGKVTAGDDVLRTFESLPTRRDGIFVMVRQPGHRAVVCHPRAA